MEKDWISVDNEKIHVVKLATLNRGLSKQSHFLVFSQDCLYNFCGNLNNKITEKIHNHKSIKYEWRFSA